ncbi:MAG: cytochrome c biogenesis protein ResB [Bacillota bacterium]
MYSFISSMKTGLAVLVLIGLASAIGSAVLPQTFYQTPVFKLLLLLLLLNMVLCTFNRIKRTIRFLLARPGSNAWFRNLGILLLHLGTVLILVGGLIYSAYGQNERIHLLVGDKEDMRQVLDIEHPFTLQLDDFKIEFNKDGSPSQYVSEVTILEQGQKVDQVTISVNHPLKYKGVKAYQYSYGYMITAEYIAENGEKKSNSFVEGDWLKPDGTDRKVKIYKYIPNFNPAHGMKTLSLRPDNPRVIFSVYEDDKFLGVGAAKFNEPVQIDENAIISFTGLEPYTVLEVKYDPGLPLVLAGGIILMLGVCLAVLTAPVRKKPAATQH